MESSSAECNASVSTKLPIIDNGNDVKLRDDVIIRIKEHLFKSVTAISNYVKTFGFSENRFIV